MMVRMFPESLDSPLSDQILLAWLQAATDDDRADVLARHRADLAPDHPAAWLALAQGGPSYGGDRQAELTFQLALLELVMAAAEHLGLSAIAGEAGRLLAAHLADVPRKGHQRLEILERAIAHLVEAEDWRGVWRAERELGQLLETLHRPELAIAAYDRSVKAAMRLPTPDAEAHEAIDALATLALEEGRPALALGTMHQWLDHCRDHRDHVAVGWASYGLGAHLIAMGEYEEALPTVREALAFFGEMGEDLALMKAHIQMMVATYALGDQERASKHLEEVIRLRERVQDPEALEAIERQFGSFL